MGNCADGRGRVEGDRRSGAELADASEGAVEVTARLSVDDQQPAACLDVPRRQLVGVLHHEVGLEQDGGVGPAGGDDIRSEGEVGHEAAVHHVPLDAVDTGRLEGRDLLTQAGEVGGQDGRRDLDGPVGSKELGHREPSSHASTVVP